ncbi:MAG TPA: sugar phosphate nucleotidyltransferase [Acidobacteriota bacterium]
MRALILAAGASTRAWPLTATRPKPLLPVANRPHLEYLLAGLAGRVDEVIVVIGYRAAELRRWLLERRGPPRIRTVLQAEARGTGDAVLQARRHLKREFLVLNGDDLFEPVDIDPMIAAPGCAVLVAPVADPRNRGVVRLHGRRIVDILEKPRRPPSRLAAIGMYRLDGAIFPVLRDQPLSSRGENELTQAIAVLARRGRVEAVRRAGLWYALGYPWDLLRANHLQLRRFHRGVSLGAGAEVGRDAALRGTVLVDDGVVLGSRCRVHGPSALGAGARIGAGARVVASVLLPGAVVEEDAIVEHSVLGAGARVGAGARLSSRPKAATVKVRVKGRLIDSGLKRLGAILGDRTDVSPGAVLNPGTLQSCE